MNEYEVGQTYRFRDTWYTYKGGDPRDRTSWARASRAEIRQAERGASPTPQTAGASGADAAAVRATAGPAAGSPQIGGLLRTLANVPLLGAQDEIEGGIGAVLGRLQGQPMGEAYTQTRDHARQSKAQFREDLGQIPTALLEFAAGAATPGLMPFLRTPTVGAMRQGAAAGAVAGSMEADGGPTERAAGLGLGTAFGGVLGGMVGGMNVMRGPDGRAQARMARAMAREPESLESLLGRAQHGETLMDLSRPVRDMGEAAVTVPSRGARQITEMLETRAAGQAERLTRGLERHTGLRFDNATRTLDDLIATRRANAAPLYARAYEDRIPFTAVADELSIPEFRRAYDRGRRMARIDGIELPELPSMEVLGMGIPADKLPVDDFPVEAVDYMKRGVDDMVRAAQRRGDANAARVLSGRLGAMLERVDAASPSFAAARKQFAGDVAMQNAFEEGRDQFLRMNRFEMEAHLNKMTPSEREMFQRGGLDAVRLRLDRMGDGHDRVRFLHGNPDVRERLKLLFNDPQELDRWRAFADAERTMRQTESAITGNSRTAARLAGQEDLAGEQVVRRLSDLMRPIGMAERALDNVAGRAQQAMGIEQTVNRLAPMISKPVNQGDLAAYLQSFATDEARRRALVGMVGRGAGTAGGLFSARRD